ncbi:Thioredoxin [hydrothermal vent metagenome]|uniref:Thioredoxin n=1 Tax=hydrothermal vent metagenome TaxID=652676 RepID=A0A3B0WF24_9ZZZZ
MPIEVTKETVDTAVLQEKLPVLLDFWADWCPPCHTVSQWLERLAPECEGKLIVAKVDVTTDKTVAEQFGVMSLPTLLWIVNGTVQYRQADEINEEGLRDWVESLL